MGHAILTGGSSGIGLELARLLLAGGHRGSLVARCEEGLEAARRALGDEAAKRIHLASADVTDADRLRAALAACEAVQGPCDRLLTSAGRVDPQFFDRMSPDLFARQIEVNFMGTVHAVRAVLPSMKARGAGRIMMISSGAALIGLPGYAAYCASKAALAAFAEALRQEAGPFGITVSISFPPDTLTPQYEREILLRPRQAAAIMGALSPWPVTKVARRIFEGLERGRAQTHFGLSLTMLALFGPLLKPAIFRAARRRGMRGL